jgi:hypothetical protein
MDFKGKGLRLGDDYVAQAAGLLGCDAPAVWAVIDTETNGHGFDAEGRPKALFERHKFYHNLPDDKRALAVRKGLAIPKWKPGAYPKTSDGVYEQIVAACAIDEDAALKSVSWGLGQIMGENHEGAGYDTVQAMVEAFKESEGNQLEGMTHLLMSMGLADEMQRHDWAAVARGWNGAGYAENHYDTKLASNYAKRGGEGKVPLHRVELAKAAQTAVAAMGSRGPIVEEVQRKLLDAGLHVTADGDFGPATKKAVADFQTLSGLPSTGFVDAPTLGALRVVASSTVSPERATATAADLKADGSKIVASGQAVQKAGIIGGGAIAALQAADKTGVIDSISKFADQAHDVADKANGVAQGAQGAVDSATQAVQAAQHVAGPVSQVLHLAVHYWWIVAVVALLAAAFYGGEAVKARVADHRSGKTL